MTIMVAAVVGLVTFIVVWMMSKNFLIAIPLSLGAFLVALGLLGFTFNWTGLLGLFR